MIPTQAHQGHYWNTNDAAGLPFNEAGPEQPKTVRCYNMKDHLNRGECRDVPVDTLELLAPGIFGEGRPSGLGSTTRWTGDSHRHGVYRNPAGLTRMAWLSSKHTAAGCMAMPSTIWLPARPGKELHVTSHQK